jgi:hypothetical protein
LTALISFGAGDEPSASGWGTLVPIGAVKTSTENRSSNTTMTSDAVLRADYTTNATYTIDGLIIHSSNSTADFKWQVADSGSATLIYLSVLGVTSGGSTEIKQEGTNGTVFTGEGASANRSMWVTGTVVVGGTPGALIVQWAQKVSDPSTTSVVAGSHFILRQVA